MLSTFLVRFGFPCKSNYAVKCSVTLQPMLNFLKLSKMAKCAVFYVSSRSMKNSIGVCNRNTSFYRFDYLESLQVVDKNIWHPQIVDQVQINGLQLVNICRSGISMTLTIDIDGNGLGDCNFHSLVLEEAGVDLQPRLAPLDVKVEAEGDAEVPVVDLEHVGNVDLDSCNHKCH